MGWDDPLYICFCGVRGSVIMVILIARILHFNSVYQGISWMTSSWPGVLEMHVIYIWMLIKCLIFQFEMNSLRNPVDIMNDLNITPNRSIISRWERPNHNRAKSWFYDPVKWHVRSRFIPFYTFTLTESSNLYVMQLTCIGLFYLLSLWIRGIEKKLFKYI